MADCCWRGISKGREFAMTRMRCGVSHGLAYTDFALCVGQPEPEIPPCLYLPPKAYGVVEEHGDKTKGLGDNHSKSFAFKAL